MTDFTELKSPTPLEDGASMPWSQQQHPLETANWLSYITISWLDKLIRKGMKTPLGEEDIWPLATSDSVEAIYPQMMHHWKKSQSPKLHLVIWNAFFRRINITFLLLAIYAVMSLVQPLAVKAMLQFLQHDGDEPANTVLGISNGYILALVLFILSTASVAFMDFAGYYGLHIGVNIKSALSHMVFVKTLSLSGTSKVKYTSGEVVTMSSVDLERVAGAFNVGQWAFISPIMLLAIYVMLGFQLDFLSAIVGGCAMTIFIIFGFVTGETIGNLREAMLEIQAERVKLTNELLQGIRVVKLCAWEEPMKVELHGIRLRELACLKRYHNLRMINNVFLIVAPIVSLASSLMVFVARGNELTLPVAFTALAYINATRQPCGVFSIAVVATTEALASCRRLTDFLNSDELKVLPLEAAEDIPHVCITNGNFSWSNDPASPTLREINLQIEPKTLTMVVGTVGCGKSSLLSAILGDIHLVNGERSVEARFSYSSQESWIRHATVKENILFESEMNQEMYNQILSACQLTPDLAMLPKGDDTEIGERGINLSGGQKARISLARAMYHRDAHLYLLDDILSALDIHVANAVFTECIQELLREKTTILVLSSHYHLLPYADRVILMDNGQIISDGTYEQVSKEHPHLVTSSNSLPSPNEPTQVDTSENNEDVGLVEKEDKVDGQVTYGTYYSYFNASGFNGYFIGFIILLFCTLSQVSLGMTDWFMSVWSKNGPTSLSYGWGYVGLAISSCVLVYGHSIFILFTSVLCSKNFHYKVLSNVIHAPVPTFFDVTPVGRILNRFSSDLDTIDSTLPHFILYVVEYLFGFASTVLVCAISTPWIILFFIPIGYVFLYAKRAYNATTNEVKRLDGITRSPLVSLVSETYQGLTTIRAFGKAEKISMKQQNAVDYNMRFNLTQAIASRWFPLRLDVLGAVIVAAVAFLVVATKSSIGLAAAGLSLTYSAQFSYNLARMAIFTAWLDNFMTSVERLNHYNTLEKEDAIECKPQPNWPSNGAISFETFSMRYRDNLDLVLRDISFTVDAGLQVGICGRTGSGKSSLMAALFRVVPSASGRISIDGIDIANVSLKALRSALTIIPQDPVLFSGSIRFNLDPTRSASDADLWRVVKQVHLENVISNLEFEITEKGSNLSVGQRQLVCIARALLRESKIVVLDEATASIDPESDRLIQLTMSECFQSITRLIIAHRIETIANSDRILVLNAGVVMEYDTPANLLANANSMYAQLAQHIDK